jgi:poly-gamma-glutamate synthesis protein (capsule biosynthesis protein)
MEPESNLVNSVLLEKHKADVLIVSLHWGGNWGYEVPEQHKSLAHSLIDAGADIVFGQSPHVFRGVEIYKDKPIVYSAGNFIDDYAIDPFERNDQSFIFVVDMVPQKILRLTLCPTIIEDCQAKLASGEVASRVAHKMMELCKPFNTKAEWHKTQDYLEINIYDQAPTFPWYERASAASGSFGRI